MGNDTRPLLRLEGISKHFPGVVANHKVSLSLEAGEIHGLLGENGAGKTTLMQILYGLLSPDEGDIYVREEPVTISEPRDALALGIGMVHQHFMLVPDMTVAENVALGLPSSRPPFTQLHKVATRIESLASQHGLNIDPWSRIDELSVGARQRVELLKLLYRGADILILDEPTAVLRPQEWDELAAILRSLADDDRGVIFITHKLHELLELADRCTVLRSGEVVGHVDVAETDKSTLARMMVGREIVLRVPRVEVQPGNVILSVDGLSVTDGGGRPLLNNLTFDVHEGEILGVAGVDGNGQQDLVDVISGMTQPSHGSISVDGTRVTHMTPRLFKSVGSAVIPEDRHKAGLALELSVRDNLMMRDFWEPPAARRGILNLRILGTCSASLIQDYDIRTAGADVRMSQLSGGNQQKVVLAREMNHDPRLLIAAQPTRGLDVGAMEFVYNQILDHKRRGGATLLISSELDEIHSLSDRIAVMSNGEFMDILDLDEADDQRLGLLMAGERGSSQ